MGADGVSFVTAPSPIVKAVLNIGAWSRLCDELKLEDPPTVRIINGRISGVNIGASAICMGVHNNSDNSITITLDISQYESDRLIAAQTELCRVLLHEARHAYQWQNWTRDRISADKRKPYEKQEMETDAREFEDRVVDYRTVIKVSRKFPSSGMSRLGATARGVRGRG